MLRLVKLNGGVINWGVNAIDTLADTLIIANGTLQTLVSGMIKQGLLQKKKEVSLEITKRGMSVLPPSENE